MKKLILVSILIMVLVSTALVGCGAKTTAPAPAQAPQVIPSPQQQTGKFLAIEPKVAPAPAPEPTGKVYKLRYNDWGPAFIDLGVRAREMAQLVNERTGGHVEIECYFAESLLKRADTYRGLEAGLADMALYVLGTNGGVHQINRVIDLPGNGVPGQTAQRDIYYKLMELYPEMAKEYGNGYPMVNRGLPAEHIHTTDKFKQVITPDDIAGLKTYANPLWSKQFESKGAAVISVPVMEWYTSLERNLTQGMFIHWLVMYSFGINELIKYHTIVGESGLGMQSITFLFNRDSMAALPPEYAEIIRQAFIEWNDAALAVDDPVTIQAGIDQAKEYGNTIVELTPAQQQVWFDFAKPIHEQWIADSEKAGYSNAREIYNTMMDLVEEYKTKGHLD